jgi:fibro-slime domain-containing protein
MKSKSLIRHLTWVLVLLLAGFTATNAAVTCSDKVIHVKVPANWSTLYYFTGGIFTSVPASARLNGWYSFSMTGGLGSTFIFGAGNTYSNLWITKNTKGATAINGFNSRDYQGDVFNCSEITGTDAYFYEDLNNPGQTLVSAMPPRVQTVFFLLPDDAAWLQGRPQIIVNGGTPETMHPDPDRCGWFQYTFLNESRSLANILFTLDSDPSNILGAEGSNASSATPIDLAAKFSALPSGGTELFFNPEEGALGWFPTDPGDVRQCGFNLAAVLYDTDASLHGAFSCDNYPNYAATACSTAVTYFVAGKIPCIGVTRGIVQPTLNSASRLPTYNPSSGCFESATKFDQLFRATPNVNKKACYDLNFQRATDGLWEYDSYNEPSQGFFPLEAEPNSGTGTKRTAYGAIKLGTGATGTLNWGSINPATGIPFIDTRPTANGEYDMGTNPDIYDNSAWGACTNTSISGTCRVSGTKNQHFCMESHSDFVYRAGQTFSVRGDDDIWVFINNKLVVDLGGTHMAAPGVVKLDTMGLTPGTSYKFDFFQCDRRTDMSNLRIHSNILFSQQGQGLYAELTPPGTYKIMKQAGGSDCAAMLNPGSGPIDGSLLDLNYFLTQSSGDSVQTYTGQAAWFGGIKIAAGTVTIDTSKFAGLAPGRYRLNIWEVSVPISKVIINISIGDASNALLPKGKSLIGKKSSKSGKTPRDLLGRKPRK